LLPYNFRDEKRYNKKLQTHFKMKLTAFKYRKINLFRFITSAAVVLLIIGITACEKDEKPDFNAAFSTEMVDDNHVKFINNSTGEYYWIVYDYGNGNADTLTDKKAQPEVYFPAAGTYEVVMTLTNFYGDKKSTSQSVTIANDDVSVSFTAEINAENPNYVLLTNTSMGLYDSFKWQFRDQEVVDVDVYTAYFPFAGDYDIHLIVMLGESEFTSTQTINIAEDDPDYDPNLIWAEEFNYTGMPDPGRWNMETGGGGWGNNELQTYTDSENNAYVDNGVLTITAIDEGGGSYTSARMTTQGKFDFKYGRVEARIKLPYGKGLWPAFWMLGANFNSVGWPRCGEIDIMEMVGGDVEPNSDNTCHATMHWWDDTQEAKVDYGLPYTLPNGIFADDFHVFGVEWDSQSVRAYMDGIEYFVADITPSELSEFQNNFFIILNMAVGGDWPGSPDDTTVFPQTMEVDWVRVYAE
jgi:beta-glucanase (GH16 family)